uniref:Uncharacterized protein n=1 Tax=viral metagenome TaxID=1070528 RepID=A0A6C0ES05_9ZZZZ
MPRKTRRLKTRCLKTRRLKTRRLKTRRLKGGANQTSSSKVTIDYYEGVKLKIRIDGNKVTDSDNLQIPVGYTLLAINGIPFNPSENLIQVLNRSFKKSLFNIFNKKSVKLIFMKKEIEQIKTSNHTPTIKTNIVFAENSLYSYVDLKPNNKYIIQITNITGENRGFVLGAFYDVTYLRDRKKFEIDDHNGETKTIRFLNKGCAKVTLSCLKEITSGVYTDEDTKNNSIEYMIFDLPYETNLTTLQNLN